MTTQPPSRGEVWVDHDGLEVLVLSVDALNHGRMRDVVCLQVDPGDQADDAESPYALVVEVSMDGGVEERTIFLDELFLVAKEDLDRPVWVVPPDVLEEAESALEEILTPAAAPAGAPERPKGYPRTSEIRFADLHIPGEAEKPVVVVSSEAYGQLVGHAFVVACRVSSNSTTVREFEVKLRSQNGKVVCSHVQTVRLGDITYRTTGGASHVTPAEADEIRRTVSSLLGL